MQSQSVNTRFASEDSLQAVRVHRLGQVLVEPCFPGTATVFLLTVILVDLAMYLIVIRPLRRVSKNADIISKGEIDLPPLEIKGRDEIAEVTASFNRMHTSLVKAFEMLNS